MLACDALTHILKVLGDPTRLRILALLEREELSVGELSRALALSQSRTSNHLRVLRRVGLLAERHAGSNVFLRLSTHPTDGVASDLWRALEDPLRRAPEHAADLERLERVLAERESDTREFFDRVAGEWDKFGVEFATGVARQRALAQLLPSELVLADLGCGTGYVSRAMLGLCGKLVCVDRSERMLATARAELGKTPSRTQLDFRSGDLDRLPIADAELDGLVAAMVLHHVPSLEPAVAEMRRVLKPGGSAVVVELAPHREGWMHEAHGDRHLGLEAGDVIAAFERAGFVDLVLEPADDRYLPRNPSEPDSNAPELSLYLVRGRAPRRT